MSRVLSLLDQAKEKVKSARESAAQNLPAAWPKARGLKNICIMGSTGSIGKNTLDVVRIHPELFCVKVLAARKSTDLLFQQAKEFRPKMVCVYDKEKALELEKKLKRYDILVVSGEEGLIEAATHPTVDEVIFAMVGAVGLAPIFASVRAGKTVAIANKEPLVMAGDVLVEEARKNFVALLPIDSEHSGLWQCLHGQPEHRVKKMILTSSGGPFRKKKGSFASITPSQALKHPKWKMGPKITIDSATLMNKGLEVIEAANLFGVGADKIEVLIHPEAVIHAMVEFVDGTHMANLAVTDMRVPIQYALSYPERLENHLPQLDFSKIQKLHFNKPDMKRFPCLALGYEASRIGGSMPSVINAANEVLVEAFLNRRIRFTDIARNIEKVMKRHRTVKKVSLRQILDADQWAREEARRTV